MRGTQQKLNRQHADQPTIMVTTPVREERSWVPGLYVPGHEVKISGVFDHKTQGSGLVAHQFGKSSLGGPRVAPRMQDNDSYISCMAIIYQTCNRCGALMGDVEKHRKSHDREDGLWQTLGLLADAGADLIPIIRERIGGSRGDRP